MYYLAGVVGIEPTVFALEASGLPLTDTPIFLPSNYRHFLPFCKAPHNIYTFTPSPACGIITAYYHWQFFMVRRIAISVSMILAVASYAAPTFALTADDMTEVTGATAEDTLSESFASGDFNGDGY